MDNPNHFALLSKQFETIQCYLPGSGDPTIRGFRHRALEQAEKLKAPTIKQNTWKYANLEALNTIKPKLHRHRVAIHDLTSLSEKLLNIKPALSLVFVNGFYISSLSELNTKANITIKHFKAMSETQDALLEELLESSSLSKNYFHQLNAALVNDGSLIIIPSECKLEQPILITHFLIDNGNHDYWISPQTHIYVEKNAQANIIEHTLSLAKGFSCLNSQTFITVHPYSQSHYLRIEEGNTQSHSFSYIHATQLKSSKLYVTACTLKGKYHRIEIENNLNEKEAYFSLNGIMLPQTNTHHDWVSKLHHLAPSCESIQTVKSIIGDEGHGSYLGLIAVNQHSTKTNATMNNHNLLLGKNGRADSSPQLEILCDDVKCNHGSITDQLDENILFYLRSRGLTQEQATLLMLSSYIDPIIQPIHDKHSQHWVKKTISQAFKNMLQGDDHGV